MTKFKILENIDEILNVEPRSVQDSLWFISPLILYPALVGARAETQNYIFDNMSATAAEVGRIKLKSLEEGTENPKVDLDVARRQVLVIVSHILRLKSDKWEMSRSF